MRTFKIFLPSILWFLLIAFLCGMPGKDIPSISWLELLSFDKWVHAGIFFVLQILLVKALRRQPNSVKMRHNNLKIAACFCIAYGGILEILQGLIFSDRTADLYDFIANSTGVLVATLLIKKNRIKFVKESYF